ncbi:hypothetical protein Asppvi_007037 [Aspergillus pseudoviridinutans]|uniref:Aminotransferase class I/classII large domain-containing protein n=1 Tax=Aspergillus pseudoviridinutans TaxID=1517512 RepID=A0A9P3EWT2_9EURO|nr:uncharacterized protein Asppvi_007037 [Aspergillus pseudoviridinutans]GIJ88120.1 hypothetical protein Asppvi_007037 [Aspergillus pseudoviridinutans]
MNDQPLLNQRVHDILERRRREGSLLIPPSPRSHDTVDFGSNDILSLSSSRVLSKAFLDEIAKHPDFEIGSPGGRVGGGPTAYLTEVESFIARVHRAESATYFNSGYDANVAIWSSIPRKGDVIIHDKETHASTYDGMRHNRATQIPFAHNNVDSFRKSVRSAQSQFPEIAAGKKLVFFAVDSFYSIAGDIVPIHQLLLVAAELLPHKNYVFVVDEAHSNGLLGPNGSGFISFWGLEAEVAIRVHTFGKGPGATGAAVLATKDIKLMLLNFARNLIFSTGPTFPALATVKASYNLITSQEGEKRRESLQKNIIHFYRGLEAHPQWKKIEQLGILRVPLLQDWDMRPFQTPIIVLYTQEGQSKPLADELGRRKYRVQQGGHPFVPRGLEGIRIMIHAGNTEQEIDGLLEAVIAWSDTRSKTMAEVSLRSKL